MANTELDGLDFLLKDGQYEDSSACFGIINTWYSLSYIYFIILEGANIPTSLGDLAQEL